MNIISKSDAESAGLKRYFTGLPCTNGHLSERKVVNGACVECSRVQLAKWRALNHDKILAYHKKSYVKNRESVRERQAVYRSNNRGKVRALTAQWAESNPEKAKAAVYKWRDNNPHMVNAQHARRREAKLNARPNWLDAVHDQEISMIYKLAADTTESTGVPHVVDHIVPLQGITVCGLHVPWNLRVITASENCSKQNKLID